MAGAAAAAVAPLAIAAILVIVWVRHIAVPAVVPADSPLELGFSADRARDVVVDLAACGIKYVGSKANEVCAVEAVIRHVEAATKGQPGSVEVDVQSASGHYYVDFLGGLTGVYRNLSNVVVRLHGRNSHGARPPAGSCALLVSSHFDSTFGSPAASDANAEISIMVELLRLLARAPPAADVIFNFNGGEEMLMPAAHGFISSHPWAKDLCAVVNLESTGSGGRELLFQAGPWNRWIVEAYGRRVSRPHGASLTQAFFQTGLIPGDTDYRIYRDFGGLPGVDFAVTANDYVYHTLRDDLAHMDFRSVQRYGQTVWELVQGMTEVLGAGRPAGPEAQEAAVFFDVAGAFFVTYSATVARQVHTAASLAALTWALRPAALGGSPAAAAGAAARLLAAFVGCLLAAALLGLALACTPASLAASGHPTLSLLVYGCGVLLAFVQLLEWLAGRAGLSAEAALRGSAILSASFCLLLTATDVGIIGSYPFLFWAACPMLGDLLLGCLPRGPGGERTAVCALLLALSHAPPWLLQCQYGVLLVELLCPLSMRSGTTIPGDVILGAAYAVVVGSLATFSATFVVAVPSRVAKPLLGGAFAVGLLLVFTTFPYSHDRPKRLYMQDVARSRRTWDFTQDLSAAAVPSAMESGIWTCAMDWNNVDTLEAHGPFGLPPGGRVDDSAGLYGEVPEPFPIKAFIAGGWWSPGPPPVLPHSLDVRMHVTESKVVDYKQLHISVWGGPQVMLALGPRAAIRRWSLGRDDDRHEASDAGPDAAGLPAELPPARDDCDCFWLLFNEGGASPTRGRSEAFNFTLAVQGDVRLDVWSTHLETTSPRLQAQLDRAPHWANLAGWASELQVHEVRL